MNNQQMYIRNVSKMIILRRVVIYAVCFAVSHLYIVSSASGAALSVVTATATDSTRADSGWTRWPLLKPSLRYGTDTSVSPCDDFDGFANGGWRKNVQFPAGVMNHDVFAFASTRTSATLRRLFDSLPVRATRSSDPVIRTVAMYYESCLLADSLERSIAMMSMQGAIRSDTSRAARCARLAQRDLPDEVGYLFVSELLPSSVEAKVRTMVTNIQNAASRRIDQIQWMEPAAKARATQILRNMSLRVARPTLSTNHAQIVLDKRDFTGNRTRIKEYLWKNQVVRSQDDARKVWMLDQFTANAMYTGTIQNAIEIPAFMFQWPMFDSAGDDAMSYAAVGMIIGHEMYHGITNVSIGVEQLYDVLEKKLIAQYQAMPLINGVRAIGAPSENLPDLGGLLSAYDAWIESGGAQNRTILDGFTPEQRFFLHFARVWRSKSTSSYLSSISRGVHAAHRVRINGVLPHIPAFGKAFGCKEGDPMFRHKADRIEVW